MNHPIVERLIGRYGGEAPGPTFMVCGGLHGNEPAGVYAARRVLAALAERRAPLRGTVVAVAGNLAALAAGRRYLAVDLNRCWLEDRIRRLREEGPAEDSPEDKELQALVAVVDELTRTKSGPLVALDLHTTSGDSPPFSLMSDTLRNRRLAFALPVPVILGLEESIDGTFLEYLTERGHIAAVVESGRHDDPAAIDLHEAVIWLGLVAADALDADDVPDFRRYRRLLGDAARGLPRVVEVRHRHAILNGEHFAMKPGLRGFQLVERGEPLAHDDRGEVVAPEPGRLLMPLYQEQGDDGFFIVRKVSRFWLGVSWVLRRLKLSWILPLLPGVSRHPDRPGALRADPRIARVYVREVFHLFGFRRRRPDGDYLVFTRRRPG